MTFDAGRIRHDMSLMHYSRMSNGTAVPSNWRPSATGDTGVTWSPESATSVSYGSNANDVGTVDAGGASSLASRADHVHKGVRSVSVSSNTLYGDTTLLGEGSVGLTVSGQTIKVNVAPVAAGGGSVSYGSNSNQVSYANAPGASSLVSRADHVHLGVTSLSHTSNTFAGPVILTASGSLGITVPTPGTFNLSAVAGSGSSGGGGGGSDLVQTNSGAGSIYIPGLRGSGDVKPASPSAFDDEFETLSGWTTLGTLDTSNVTDFPSHWHVKRTNAAIAVDGIYKTAPSMPFTVTAKLKSATLLNNYDAAGILLTEASPGKLCTYNLVMNGSVLYSSLYQWTNRTTFGSTTDVTTGTVVWYPIFQYLRVIVTSSTSITCAYSREGDIWRTTHTTLTTGLTVANVGLMIGDPGAAGTVEAVWDWIRFS